MLMLRLNGPKIMPQDAFEIGGAECFAPIAKEAGLPLNKVYDGIYEIIGKQYVARIRRGFGHGGGGFVVTVSDKKILEGDPTEIIGEIGLGVSVLLTPSGGWRQDLGRVEGARERRHRSQNSAETPEPGTDCRTGPGV